MFKFVKLLLTLAHLFAQREEAKQAEKQKQFKKQQAASAITLREEAKRVQAKLDRLNGDASLANAKAALGCNKINEAERVAASLRSNLDYIVSK